MQEMDQPRRRQSDEGGEIVVTVRSWLERIERKLDDMSSRQERDASGLNARVSKVEQEVLIHQNLQSHPGTTHHFNELEGRLRAVELTAPLQGVVESLKSSHDEQEQRLRRVEADSISVERVSQYNRWLVGLGAGCVISIGLALFTYFTSLLPHVVSH